MRIGQGFDVHAFAPVGSATQFALGGISIPDDRGVVAHSDGDVLLHALMDAILGALGLEDIAISSPTPIQPIKMPIRVTYLKPLSSSCATLGFR